MSTSTQKIFLTGATGDIGHQVLRQLRETDTSDNASWRVLCRRQTQIDSFKSESIDAVLGSLDDSASTVASHMQGCDTLLLLTAATPSQLEHNKNAIDAAISAGVKWIVRISAADARHGGKVPWVTAHAQANDYLEEATRKKKVDWTIVSPSAFMQNILSEAPAIRKGFLPQTSGDGKAAWIDTADIASFTTRILLAGPKKHKSQNYILTGPELLSIPEIATILSRTIDHKVHYLHLPSSVFGLILRFSGANAFTINGLVAQFKDIIRPGLEGVKLNDHIEKITGKKPNSFEEFARRKRAGLSGVDLLPWIEKGLAAVVALATIAFFKYWV